MLNQMTAYMLDTNVFDRLADGEVSFDAFRGLPLLATHVQLDEIKAAQKNYPARAAKLLRTVEEVDPTMDRTASASWDVSNWDQSSWSPEEVEKQMLERLTHLDAAEGKKHRDPKNRIRDVLIGHTAIKNKATLISDDPRLRRLVSEFGGRAISTSDIRQGYARARWKVGLFRLWIVGSICWVVYSLWSDAAEVEDWTCWRRLVGIDEGPRCAINTEGLIELLTVLLRPPLVAGIALLVVAWIVAGFQPRSAKRSMKQVAEGARSRGSTMMLRKVWDGIADGFRGDVFGENRPGAPGVPAVEEKHGFKQRSISGRVAYCFGQLIGWALFIAVIGLIGAAAYYLPPGGTWPAVNRALPWMIGAMSIAVVLMAVIWGIEDIVHRITKRKKNPDPQD